MATNARMLVEKLDKEAKSVIDEKDLKEMRGEVLEPVQKEKNPKEEVHNREKYAEIPMMDAIGEVLNGEKPLSSLEGIINLGSYEGARMSTSGGVVAQGTSVSVQSSSPVAE